MPPLAEAVESWNDDLLPELLTARTRSVAGVVDRLTRHVVALASAGVKAFVFKDLVDPMKRDVRQRWESVWEVSLGDLATELTDDGTDGGTAVALVPVVMPTSSSLEFRQLLRCVGLAIDRQQQAIRENLWKLWTFVRNTFDQVDKRPSNVRISKALGIRRDRLPELFDVLGRLVETCRSGQDASPKEHLPENHETPRSSQHGAWRKVS